MEFRQYYNAYFHRSGAPLLWKAQGFFPNLGKNLAPEQRMEYRKAFAFLAFCVVPYALFRSGCCFFKSGGRVTFFLAAAADNGKDHKADDGHSIRDR